MVLENNIQTLNHVNSIKLNQEWHHWGIKRSKTLLTATISTLSTGSYNFISIFLYMLSTPLNFLPQFHKHLGVCVCREMVRCEFSLYYGLAASRERPSPALRLLSTFSYLPAATVKSDTGIRQWNKAFKIKVWQRTHDFQKRTEIFIES